MGLIHFRVVVFKLLAAAAGLLNLCFIQFLQAMYKEDIQLGLQDNGVNMLRKYVINGSSKSATNIHCFCLVSVY